MPFGFPSGRALVAEILGVRYARRGEFYEPMNELARKLLEAKCDLAHLAEFQARLRDSQLYSVDAFLERYPEFVDIGKTAIAGALIPRENPEAFYNVEDSWYRYLANTLVENISSERAGTLVVLTYNYDRSLEYYLYRSLQNALHLDADGMVKLMRSLIIVHLHGSLGRLPWQGQEAGQLEREYASNGDLLRVSTQIKIIHEKIDDGDDYRRAWEHLADATRVCFLGFGFHRTNVRRLAASGWTNRMGTNLHVTGTCFGMEDGERRRCQESFGGTFELLPKQCLEFLRHQVRLIG